MHNEEDALDPELMEFVSEARRPVAMGADARARLMHAIRAEPAPRRTRPIPVLAPLAWVFRPREFVLPPFATAAVAAGLVGIGVLGGALLINRDGPLAEQRTAVVAGTPQLPDSIAPLVVEFRLVAPSAARVAVVGDFNGWNPAATPMRGEDGTWKVFVPLRPGLHTYSFVIDGSHFIPDPAAPRAPDDGFGSANSVVFVRSADRTGGTSL